MLCAQLTTDRAKLLERTKDYQTENRFDLSSNKYVPTTRIECAGRKYQREIEPIVPTEEYDLGSAWLTVNAYNALILNTTDMFIADIDCGDPRFNRFATVSSVAEVLENLNGLNDFDRANKTDFAGQCWRLYSTHSGFRLMCVSKPIRQHDGESHMLLRFLRADPKYIELCDEQHNYRARLTPKPWRNEEQVCELIEQRGDEIHPLLKEQLRLHDELTLEMASC